MCDTFVVLPEARNKTSIIFGKNSDREPNEVQAIEYHRGGSHGARQRLKCTYLEVPQVRHTYATLISRPFWMWGAEIGANECGVAIGNEAVWSKMPLEKGRALTGMDLLRLALERADTAENAIDVITGLLADFGQGGNCGYQSRMYYHNSYIIADPRSAWVLETAGNLWVALKITDRYAISNGLSIGGDFTIAHPELISTARQKGWLKKGQDFHFSECYRDWFYTTFSGSRARRDRSLALINKHRAFSVENAFAALRQHAGDDYHPDSHLLMNSVCAHSANPLSRHAAQTTGSLVAELNSEQSTFWFTGTAAPCTSIFKPFRFSGQAEMDFGSQPAAEYNNDDIWWRHELVHRSILADFQQRLASIQSERDKVEQHFLAQVREHETGDIDAVTASALSTADKITVGWHRRFEHKTIQRPGRWYYRKYWRSQIKRAGLSRHLPN